MSTLRSPWQDDGGLPPDLPLEDYPGTLLLRLAQSIQQEITSTYARANGVSIAEARLLARLHAEGPLPLGDLCRALAMDKAYASRILRSLQPQGFIDVAADPEHGRRLIVSITPAGRTLARRLLASARERQQLLPRALGGEGHRVHRRGSITSLRCVDSRTAAGIRWVPCLLPLLPPPRPRVTRCCGGSRLRFATTSSSTCSRSA